MRDRAEDLSQGWLSGGLRAVGAALQTIPRRWAWIPLVGWMGLIFYLSSRTVPEWGGPGSVGSVLRNSGHAVEYGMLALLSALCVPRRLGWPEIDRRRFLVMLVLILVYAASDEWHQNFTPHRDASVCDAVTDMVGASLTLGAIVFAGGARASEEKLARIFLLGIPAVLLAGAMASYLPRFFPGVSWL